MNADQIADRQQEWAHLTQAQRAQRVQFALLDFQDYAALRRREVRRQMASRRAAEPTKVKEYEPL